MTSMYKALQRAESTRRTPLALPALPTSPVSRQEFTPSRPDYERLKVMLSVATGGSVRRVLLVSASPDDGVASVTLGLATALATWDRLRSAAYQPAWVMIE